MDIVSETEKFIIDRIKGINNRADNGLEDNIDDVKSEIQEFISEWQKKAEAANDSKTPLFFGRRFMVALPSAGVNRLLRQYNSSGKDNSIETLTSMRNVDTQVVGKIVIWEG
ncbi:hypothetical protein SDC9_127516 [bioreactor metagenome]|uniref:Uncharacterized protein n=1 Tax=bioreactor metagenome TaxID=1076179 RepID=A0A645CU96_9ZZZZ